MSSGTGGIVRAAILGLVLGAAPVAAQTPVGGTWTDPPARAAAPTPPVSAPAAKAVETMPPAPKAEVVRSAEPKPIVTEATTRKRATAQVRIPVRETKRMRPSIVAAAPRARLRLVERREAKPVRRVVARSFAARYVEAQPYDVAPMPVGRVEGPVYGERNPVFDDGHDRTRRIAAAQAAGYLVVRARSVQFPDGRTLRTYRPYEADDD